MPDATVRIYESELQCIADETARYPEIETGGSLFGLWTHSANPTVVLATRPGPRAIRDVMQFEQDADLHRNLEDKMVNLFGVQSVGLWHSHHQLGLHELSGGDRTRTMNFAARSGRSAFCDLLTFFEGTQRGGSLIRGSRKRLEVSVRPYVYVDAGLGLRAATAFAVLPGKSPLRQAMEDRPRDFKFAREALEPSANAGVDLQLMTSGGTESGQRSHAAASHETALTHDFSGSGRELSRLAPAELGAEMPAADNNLEHEEPPPQHAISDMNRYITEFLEPLLRDHAAHIVMNLEPDDANRNLFLYLTSPHTADQVVLQLGWDGVPVASRLRVRRSSGAMEELIVPGAVVRADTAIADAVERLGARKKSRYPR